jgi:hypothetical protein
VGCGISDIELSGCVNTHLSKSYESQNETAEA